MTPDLATLIQTYVSALERRDYAAAREAVDAAVDLAPSSAEAWGCRGEFYRYYGRQLTLALSCFERAAILDPVSHLGPGCAASVYEELERPGPAMEGWEEAISRSPGHPDLWRARARLKDQGGDFEGALSDLDEAIRLAPAEVDAHCLRGEVLLRAQRLEEALRAFERALRVARGHVRSRAGRSTALGALGRVDEANMARPRGEADPGVLRELTFDVEGEPVSLRYRVVPGDEAGQLRAQGQTWLRALPRSPLGTTLVGLCGWRLGVIDTPGGLVLAEYDLDRRPWRAAVPRLEVTHSLRAETRAAELLSRLGVEGQEVVLSQSARICPEALARSPVGELRMRRDAPVSPEDSGWRVGPVDPVEFARATRGDRFGRWPPLEFVLEETMELLPYLTLPPGFEVLIVEGELASVRDPGGSERLAA